MNLKSFLLASCLVLLTANSAHSETARPSVTIATSPALGTLSFIAERNGYFKEAGIDVTLERLQTGRLITDALVSRRADVGTVVDANIGFLGFQEHDLKLLASLGIRLDESIQYRKDSGVRAPIDLRGKRIGYIPGTTSHIFLSRFLERNGLSFGDIKPVSLQIASLESAISGKTVDAVSIWEPWGASVARRLGDGGGSFSNSAELYPTRILLAATSAFISRKPEAVRPLLAALDRARIFLDENPAEAQRITAEALALPNEDAARIIATARYFDFLHHADPELVSHLGTIGAWIAATVDEFKGRPVPNFGALLVDAPATHGGSTAAAPPPKEKISIGFCRPNNMVSALPYIAEAKGYFSEEALEIRYEVATNAKICQDLLVAGKVDFMTGADGPFTFLATSNPDVSIIAMLQKNPETSVFARKDRGIASFKDLKGKRIAYLPGTVSGFFLDRLLEREGLLRSDVKLMAMQPPTMPTALVGGAVDAFVMWEPWGQHALEQLGENGVHLEATELYQYEAMLSVAKKVLREKPDAAKRVVRALIRAEDFLKREPSAGVEILAKSISFTLPTLQKLWPGYVNHVRIDDVPVKLMTQNFNYLKRFDENFADADVPNYRTFVDPSVMLEVAPDRVTLDALSEPRGSTIPAARGSESAGMRNPHD